MSLVVHHQFNNEESSHDPQRVVIPTDTILQCQEGLFSVHRRFLASKLEYFRSLFDRDLNNHIEIRDMSKEALDVILSSIYYGRFKTMNYALTPEFLIVFQKIKYQEAYEWYLKMHLKCLSKDNWETFWELGEKLNEDRVFKAVSNLIRYNYNLPQFLLSQMKWKLFTYLSNNKDYEILVKIALCFTNDLESINKLSSLIDFGELQDHYLSLVSRNPLLSTSPAFRDKGYRILCDRFQFLSENYFINDCVCDLILLGQDKDKSVVTVIYSSGAWRHLLDMNKEDFSVLHLSVNRKDLNILGIQNNEQHLLQHTVYRTNMCRDRETILGSTFEDAKISCVVLDDTVVGTVYNFEKQCEFIGKDTKYTKYFKEETETIIRIQLVRCKGEVYMLKQVKVREKLNILTIYKLSSLNEDREWEPQSQIDKADSSHKWFAYFFPPLSIAVRFIGSSRSFYYNTETQILQETSENNMIIGAVCMDLFRWNVVCLSSDGFVYYQDMRVPRSNWKTIRKCPVNLSSYQQVTCVSSL